MYVELDGVNECSYNREGPVTEHNKILMNV